MSSTAAIQYWEVPNMPISIETDITGSVKEFAYAKNSHYLKLKDDKGSETKLVEHGLLRFWCVPCNYIWFSQENRGNRCPVCGDADHISQQWMKPQLALIPEDESSFQMPPKSKGADKT